MQSIKLQNVFIHSFYFQHIQEIISQQKISKLKDNVNNSL